MQAMVSKFALQAALVGSMSLGSFVIKKVYKVKNHEFIENTIHLKYYSDLCYALNGISLLENDKLFGCIVQTLDDMFILIEYGKGYNLPWVVNRKISDIVNVAKEMKQIALRSQEDRLVVAAIDFEKDFFPVFQTQLDNILHNMLLSRV
jgi:hypothetical protein